MESAAEPDDPEFEDAAHCWAAPHRPVVSPAKESAENAVKAPQIVGATKRAETPGAAQITKEAAENAVEALQIVGAAEVVETPGAARIVLEAVEAGEDPDAGDAAPYWAALHSVGLTKGGNSLGSEDAALWGGTAEQRFSRRWQGTFEDCSSE